METRQKSPPTTPLARTKGAALLRVQDCANRGYTYHTGGQIPADKALALASKLHQQYGIGLNEAARLTRKKKGLPNAILVMYWPEDADQVAWLLLATAPIEKGMRSIEGKPRLTYIGFQFKRYSARGRTSWTWYRDDDSMGALYDTLALQIKRRDWKATATTVEILARIPGFHGVRDQLKRVWQHIKAAGYPDPLPRLCYIEKISHGDRIELQTRR